MVFCFGTYIYEWLSKLLGYKSALCNGTCGNAGNGVGLGELLKDKIGKAKLYACAQFGEREGLAVIAIEG